MQRALVAHGSRRAVDDGCALFARGDEPDGMYCVLRGAVRIGAVSENGRDIVLTWLEPCRWFGEIALIDGAPRTHDAHADGVTELLHVPQTALERHLAASPARWRDIARLSTGALRHAFTALEELAMSSPSERIARRLLMLAEERGESAVTLPLSQDRVAALLGIARQTVNRELKRLEAKGVVALRYGEIAIPDLATLRAEARPQ